MTAAAVLAAGLVGTAGLVIVPARDRSLGRLRENGASDRASVGRWAGSARILGAVIGLIGVTLWSLSDLGLALCMVVAGAFVVAAVGQRLLGRWQARQLRVSRQHAVIEVCDALAAEMRAGLPAVRAFERALDTWPEWSAVVSSARLGGDVAETLRGCAERPGAEGLRAVAAAWDVAGRSGAALADVLDRVAAGLRSDDEARAEVTAALGPPRATAKLLAALPVFGLGLGASMGAHPVSVLLDSTIGLGCLAAGMVLALLGVLWVEHLADAAEV